MAASCATIRTFVLVSLLGCVSPYNFLISHPFYGASHVLTLRAVTENLLARCNT